MWLEVFISAFMHLFTMDLHFLVTFKFNVSLKFVIRVAGHDYWDCKKNNMLWFKCNESEIYYGLLLNRMKEHYL